MRDPRVAGDLLRPGLVADRKSAIKNPADRPVGQNDPVFVGVGQLEALLGLFVGKHALAIFRVYGVEKRKRIFIQFLAGTLPHALITWADGD